MTKVKICGITNLNDAFAAVDAGADYLGFIFNPPSKHAIAPQAAQQIVNELRDYGECPYLVGVFVNNTGEQMAEIMDMCDLDFAQLSGEEVPALIGEPTSPIFGVAYKALRPASLTEAEADAEWYLPPNYKEEIKRQQAAGGRPSLLIDTYHPMLRGGIGKRNNWALSAKLAHDIPGLMLAGGLNADNVAEAVYQVRPYAIDVASGVETVPGKKDHELMRQFIQKAKTAVIE
ncbi:MAG: N-(5'-phosphoribosyl)anthranilate isomerase [Chloroflexi bacterium]|nr:MAG: N-(5'-phosphoribosyl)anthranilate isomerase [Chloroflexota bacterium]PIE79370.1 MAG: N-(5'-phosphoribosyl)anthranilate isomerase [Chloroflexota bacterium]